MSHSTSPTNRNLIFGWVKNLKKSAFLSNESINDLLDQETSQHQHHHLQHFHSQSQLPNSDPNLVSSSKQVMNGNNSNIFEDSNNTSSPLQGSISNNSGVGGSLVSNININNPNYQNNNGNVSGSYNSNNNISPTNNYNQEFLRPNTLHHQRSLNNIINRVRSNSNTVNRVRSNSYNQSEQLVRQHRDSFLQHNPIVDSGSAYFGVPLEDAIKQASARINVSVGDSERVQYGHIPLVVAKCAIFIKSNGLTVEGIFRVGGSSKRLKELQNIFNTPPEFGKKLNWDGYTVHDALSMLRRYLNALPEPLIPLEFYNDFREPLMDRQRIILYLKSRAENAQRKSESRPPELCTPTPVATPKPGELSKEAAEAAKLLKLEEKEKQQKKEKEKEASSHNESEQLLTEANVNRHNTTSNGSETKSTSQIETPVNTAVVVQSSEEKKSSLNKEVHEAIELYKQLVDRLPPLSKQLLFYILDMLSMVQDKLEQNRMSSRNLAAIFQPLILSHPDHDLDPEEYVLSQAVVEFLIHYSYKLLPNSNTNKSTKKAEFESESDTKEKETNAVKETNSDANLEKDLAPPNILQKFVDLENEANSDGDLYDDNYRNANKSNLTLDSSYKVDDRNVDSGIKSEAITVQDLSIEDKTEIVK